MSDVLVLLGPGRRPRISLLGSQGPRALRAVGLSGPLLEAAGDATTAYHWAYNPTYNIPSWPGGGFANYQSGCKPSYPDPWEDPKSRSTLGFYSLHHRSIRAQNWGIYFSDPPRGLGSE